MANRYRCMWNRFVRTYYNRSFRTVSAAPLKIQTFPWKTYTIPSALGFSVFTWLGFKEQLTAEDELIDSIKHSVLFIKRQEYDKAEQLLHVALKQAQQIQHQLGITYIYDVMANLALERVQLDKAKKLFVSVAQRIMADGVPEDDSRVVHLSVKLARVSHLQKEYSTAQLGYEWCLEKLHKAMEEDPGDGLKKLLALTEDWYGRLFIDCEKYDDGLKLLVSSLNNMRELPDLEVEHLVVQMNDIGTVLVRLDRIDDSIDYFEQAIQMGQTLDMEDLGTMYVNLGRAYMRKKLTDIARKHCGHAWKLGVSRNNEAVKREAELCLKEIKAMS